MKWSYFVGETLAKVPDYFLPYGRVKMIKRITTPVKNYVVQMQHAFGTRFLILLFLIQCLLKGMVFVIMTTGMLPLFKSLGIDAVHLQMYAAIAMSPW